MLSPDPGEVSRQRRPEILVAPPRERPRSLGLWNRNWFLLWQGQLVSRLGNQAFAIAMMFWVQDAFNSTAILGLAAALASIPGIVLEPVGGVLADRYSRKRILVLSDLAAGALVVGFAALLALVPGQHHLKLVCLMAVATGLAIINAFFGPAIAAALPDLVDAETLPKANALGQLSFQGTQLVGQGLGGLLYQFLGAPLLFLVDGLSFLFSGVSETFIEIPHRERPRPPHMRALIAAFWEDIRGGLQYVWRARGLRSFLVLSTAIQFFSTPVMLLLTFYVRDVLHQGKPWVGFMIAAFSVGAIVGYGLVLAIRISPAVRAKVIISSFMIGALGNIGLGLTTDRYAALVIAFAGGLMGGMVGVMVQTLLQLTTPPEMRGRVFGVLGTLAGSLAPVAMAMGGIAASVAGQIPAVYIGCGLAMGVLSIVIAMSRDFRAFVAYAPPPSPPARGAAASAA